MSDFMLTTRHFFLFIFLLNGVYGITQNSKEAFFAFREDWSPINDINAASYFMHRVKENDTTYVCRFYRTKGPMVKCETYKDGNLEIPHGRFAWYNQLGNIDSMGMVSNGKKDGYWEFRKADGSIAMSTLFENGKRIWTRNFSTNIATYADGRIVDLNSAAYKDSMAAVAATMKRQPAEFKGGVDRWIKYLEKNLRTPGRFREIAGNGGRGKVIVAFIIDTEGRVYDPYIDHSVEWSVDMETIRVLKESPRWTPATLNGQPVIYRHKQVITHAIY
ncbi:MAG TPA: hypothetical protein DHW64_07880 [Chitinophagaceae bacterium]|nr:hypothetical protein [Chitinophagaceae bacterium]